MKERPDIELVGQAKDGLEAFTQAEKLRPDIIFMDIAMPELNGIKATKQIVKSLPDIKISCFQCIKFFYLFYTNAYDNIIKIREKETSKFIR